MFSKAFLILPGPLDSLQLGPFQLKHIFLEGLDHVAAETSSAGKAGEFPTAYIPAQCCSLPEPTPGKNSGP